VAWVGSKGDPYDCAETVKGLHKTELIRRRGPWRTVDQVELATAELVCWWNERRLYGVPRHPAGRARRDVLSRLVAGEEVA